MLVLSSISVWRRSPSHRDSTELVISSVASHGLLKFSLVHGWFFSVLVCQLLVGDGVTLLL